MRNSWNEPSGLDSMRANDANDAAAFPWITENWNDEECITEVRMSQ